MNCIEDNKPYDQLVPVYMSVPSQDPVFSLVVAFPNYFFLSCVPM